MALTKKQIEKDSLNKRIVKNKKMVAILSEARAQLLDEGESALVKAVKRQEGSFPRL